MRAFFTRFAQCGAKRSSCSTCHDGANAAAPAEKAWHTDHAFADVCIVCHGGNGETNDVAAAHQTLVAPLADAPARCGSCHGANAASLAARYATGMAASDAGTPAPVASTTHPHGEAGPNLAFGIVVLAVAAVELGLVRRMRRTATH